MPFPKFDILKQRHVINERDFKNKVRKRDHQLCWGKGVISGWRWFYGEYMGRWVGLDLAMRENPFGLYERVYFSFL